MILAGVAVMVFLPKLTAVVPAPLVAIGAHHGCGGRTRHASPDRQRRGRPAQQLADLVLSERAVDPRHQLCVLQPRPAAIGGDRSRFSPCRLRGPTFTLGSAGGNRRPCSRSTAARSSTG